MINGWPKRPFFEWLTRDNRSLNYMMVRACRDAIADYYHDLDNRLPGDIAQDKAFRKIEQALGMRWTPGLVKGKRAAREPLDHER